MILKMEGVLSEKEKNNLFYQNYQLLENILVKKSKRIQC